MSAVLCSECKVPVSAPLSIQRGLCSRCLRELGAIPARLPGGRHDAMICRCFLCTDRMAGYADDFRADRSDGEYELGPGDA